MDDNAPGWSISILDAERAVLITTRGVFSAKTFGEMVPDALAKAQPLGYTRFVFDHRTMRPRLSTSEIYELPAALERLGWTREMRVAVVYAEQAKGAEDFKFFANMAVGKAFAYSLFVEMKPALAWVTAGD